MKACERDGCEVTFEPQRSTARFCSARCRVAAGRKASASTSVIEPGGLRAGDKIRLRASGKIPATSYTVTEVRPYPCCRHCPGHPHAAHSDPCRQGCPA